MRTAAPKHVKNAIESALKSLGLDKKIEQYEVLERWPEIVGEQIANVATAERIVEGKLFLSISRATWRNELLFRKKELIEKINASMGSEIVKDIIFR